MKRYTDISGRSHPVWHLWVACVLFAAGVPATLYAMHFVFKAFADWRAP